MRYLYSSSNGSPPSFVLCLEALLSFEQYEGNFSAERGKSEKSREREERESNGSQRLPLDTDMWDQIRPATTRQKKPTAKIIQAHRNKPNLPEHESYSNQRSNG
jgi:hypothetical protein